MVGADGVLSRFRKRQTSSDRIAIIGDARWVQDRFDLGTRRIRCGADIAIRDGIELAQILSESDANNSTGSKICLGRFCAEKKRREVLVRRGNIAVVILAMVLGRSFPFKDCNTNLAAPVFLASLIHISGRVCIRLPLTISPVPITLHTLSACWGGLALGGTVGALAGGLYALLWTVFHSYTKQEIQSWGYIVGLMPCAIVSGELHGDGVHAMLAAVAGQCCTLLTGALWLMAISEDLTKPLDVIRGGVLPFLPGLVLKSFVASKLPRYI